MKVIVLIKVKVKIQTLVKQSRSRTLIHTMLLLVTFSYLLLTTPAYIMLLYINFVNPLQSPYHYAAYILFVQFGEKACYTNFRINFFLYVLSGQKFRKDLIDLFVQRSRKIQRSVTHTSRVPTIPFPANQWSEAQQHAAFNANFKPVNIC